VVLPDQVTTAGAQYDQEVGQVLTRLTMTHGGLSKTLLLLANGSLSGTARYLVTRPAR
jgi:hypothetical protein